MSNKHHPDELWQAARRYLEKRVHPSVVAAWINGLKLSEIVEESDFIRTSLVAKNKFSADYIKKTLNDDIAAAFSSVCGKPTMIDYRVDPTGGEDLFAFHQNQAGQDVSVTTDDHYSSELDSIDPTFERNKPEVHVRPESYVIEETFLDPRYKFDSFVVGASNQFAYACSVAVAEKPAFQYNPLFLYGSPGLGKTHLLNAIGHHVKKKFPHFRICSISAEHFVNDLIDSLKHHRMAEFRKKYRESYDVILIDDIQFIAGKEKSEEEFFHTFNALHKTHRQIVVTSDRPPKEIQNLTERVRTRFESGLIADIQPPEIETRIAILRTKAENDDIYLPDDVANFIAAQIKTNVRELEGLLTKLKAQSSLTGLEISLEMAKQILKVESTTEGSEVSVEAIQNAVCRYFNIKISDLKSTKRSREIALPRQIAMYLIRKYTNYGLKEIGRFFGGKDHSTIIHACNQISKQIDSDPEVAKAVEGVQNLL